MRHIAGVIGHAGAGGPQIEVYRWPGEGEGTEGSDDEGGERETTRSRKLNRLGKCAGVSLATTTTRGF